MLTGEFTERVQKRYDDTVLLLEAPTKEGLNSTEGKAALRRINQMHAMYDISNEDMVYVMATFVVVPKRWLDDYGWRPLTAGEVEASVNYYRDLGRHMAIRDLPVDYDSFATFMDDYESENFAFDEGARRVADSTLQLLTTFYPKPAAKLVHLFSRGLMDEPLLTALQLDDPGDRARRLSLKAMQLRAGLLRHVPSRRKPVYSRDMPRIRSYPDGFDVRTMGTFTPGCPVTSAR